MIPLVLAARELGRALAAVWRDPETKALPVVAGALVLTGTLFYWRFEDWTIIEAHYFSVVALTTVGFADFTPTSAGTQIFTIIYILTGIGLLVALLTSVGQQFLSRRPSASARFATAAKVAEAGGHCSKPPGCGSMRCRGRTFAPAGARGGGPRTGRPARLRPAPPAAAGSDPDRNLRTHGVMAPPRLCRPASRTTARLWRFRLSRKAAVVQLG